MSGLESQKRDDTGKEATVALKDEMDFGFVLPCRSWAPIDVDVIRRTAVRAEGVRRRRRTVEDLAE